MSDKIYVAIDFDGTIAKYDGWKGYRHFGELIDGAKEAISVLREQGFKVIIYSTRGTIELEDYLNHNGIEYDYININPEVTTQNPGKPYADVYIDDRAFHFTGDWVDTIQQLMAIEYGELPVEVPATPAEQSKEDGDKVLDEILSEEKKEEKKPVEEPPNTQTAPEKPKGDPNNREDNL